MNLIPNVLEKTSSGERVYDLYSRLLQDRIILLSGEIDDNLSNIIVSELLYLDSINHEDINIYINSPGGSITSGMAIYDTMNYIKSDVSTICIGMAASMAAFLLSSGKKGKRYALPNSEVMIHQPLGGVNGQATEIKIAADRILKLKDKLNKILSKNTGKDLETIAQDTERDYFMDSNEAFNYGIVDKVLNNEKIKASVKFNETNEITIENEKIKGKIQINKLSEDKNNILETEAGSPIEGVKFNIYDMENKLVDTIVTDKNGVATSKKLEKGRYNVQEIETNKWYILDKKIYEAEIKENNEIVKLDIVNKSKDPKVEIKKSCKNITKSNDEIDYSFEIKNTGNVELEDFTWYDYLPADYAKITGIETGTYNKDILYNIYYKTNQKDEYMVLKKNLNGGEDNFISLTDLHLEKDEKITEIKIYFGNVDVGFKSEKKPHIIMKTNEDLENDTKIENSTVLEGYNQDYRVSSKDTAVSTIYNVVQEKKLPRTGF